jgi:hypothetical protein
MLCSPRPIRRLRGEPALLSHDDGLGKKRGRRLTRDKKRHPRLCPFSRTDRFPVLLVKQYFEVALAQIQARRIPLSYTVLIILEPRPPQISRVCLAANKTLLVFILFLCSSESVTRTGLFSEYCNLIAAAILFGICTGMDRGSASVL